jgi:hypothetical protein
MDRFLAFRCRLVKGAGLLLVVVLTAGVMLNLVGEAVAQKPILPFQPGEKLTFKIRWGVIPAGEAVLEVKAPETVEGVESHHFVMTVRTSSLVDPFYKVRDRMESHTDLSLSHSMLYTEKKGGRKKKDLRVSFDWNKNEATRISSGKTNPPVPLAPGSYDPLAVFYALRLHELEEEKEILIPVCDGKKSVLGRARVIQKETIRVGGEDHVAYLVEPELEEIGGVFEKSKGAGLKIWVTADAYRIPLRIESRVTVGSFVAELTSAEKTLGRVLPRREVPFP